MFLRYHGPGLMRFQYGQPSTFLFLSEHLYDRLYMRHLFGQQRRGLQCRRPSQTLRLLNFKRCRRRQCSPGSFETDNKRRFLQWRLTRFFGLVRIGLIRSICQTSFGRYIFWWRIRKISLRRLSIRRQWLFGRRLSIWSEWLRWGSQAGFRLWKLWGESTWVRRI